MLSVGSGIREEVVTVANKVLVAAAEGIGAVFSAADNSGSGGAGNGSGKRGSDGATILNKNAAAVGAKMVVVAAAMDVAVSAMVAVAAAATVKRQGQIVAAVAMVITRFTLRGAVPGGDPH
jgi:hypothetical protein